MARRRMFSLDVTDTDHFLELPVSSQALYFHLGMRADDDGFVSSPKRIAALIGASADDLKLLIAKGFIIPFESGVCVIREWKINNYLRSDRHTPTRYQVELSLLCVSNGVYGIPDGQPDSGIPSDNQVSTERYTQYRLGKDRKEKNNIIADKPQRTRFVKPSLEEVTAYCKERKNSVNPQSFLDHYESNGWRVGKNPMKDWKAAVRTWERNGINRGEQQTQSHTSQEQRSYSPEDLEEYPPGSGNYVLRAEIAQR